MPSLIFPKDTADAKKLSVEVQKGALKRIRQGIYTDAAWEEIPQLLNSRWYEVIQYLFPDAIASHVTAVKLRPENNIVHITADLGKRRKINISDALTIDVHPGNVAELTEQFVPQLKRSAPARLLMENLQLSHQDTDLPKALGQSWVEQELLRRLERYGETDLNLIRDEAKAHCVALGMEKECRQLDELIGALLSTRPDKVLRTPVAIATARQEPYDQGRLALFERMADYLNRCDFPPRPYQYNKSGWRNLAFYESYFSNYIEGTEFEIDEAEQIVFSKQAIPDRHEDSHDVLSVYDIVHDYTEMVTVPESANELMHLLTLRHGLIMHARSDKRPGELKVKPNKAGDTLFVLPDKVEGTLARAFSLYQQLEPGLARAVFMQFMVTECHPFDDGNGRLARIMMNAELVCHEQFKIIVPTVHRDSYLNGLRQASRSGRFRTLCKVFADLQAYTSIIPWEEYGEARSTLEAHCADKLPDEGVAVFNKQIAQFKISLPP
ncbi:Fic family protein [Bowmanella dokdonensis]|uniref:Fic family protein n=1 Tax=Bowmanella dokdonensis TaxID=751969 RepID=A0A939DQM1_9ALTE|nr:Fic family protein [Bowmanella dokdonensis]MBN7827017.1 Fic family protein [Bowmanella dokdonensis]